MFAWREEQNELAAGAFTSSTKASFGKAGFSVWQPKLCSSYFSSEIIDTYVGDGDSPQATEDTHLLALSHTDCHDNHIPFYATTEL